MAVIGIDLGTTNSLVTVFKNGKSVLIPNEYNEYLTPSIVNVSNGNVYVGRSAKERMITEPENTARQFKRDMGSEKRYTLDGTTYSSEELSALVLRKLKEDAERYLNETVEEAVISVPAYFNDKQRYATKKAGELAEIKVERLVNEPSAAALLSKIHRMKEDGNYLVFDFGGGTLDVSLVECFQNIVNVIAISGDNRLGGCDFDMAIATAFCEENHLIFTDLEKRHQSSLLFQCEKIKQQLSEENRVSETIMLGEKEYPYELSREKMVTVSNDIFKKIDRIIQRVLMDARMGMEEITEVIMVGGSSKMPVVKQYVRFLLGDSVSLLEEEPDTIVAQGVGVYAGIKERKAEIKDIILTDICPFSLGVDIHNENEERNPLMNVIIGRNTPLPVARRRSYYTVKDFQKKMNFQIYQGENYYAKDNLRLGKIKVAITPKPKGEEEVQVTFAYDINGLLLVVIEVPSTGKSYEMVISGRDDISKEEKEYRIKELAKLQVASEAPENLELIKYTLQIYEELSPDQQEQVGNLLVNFERSLSSNRLQYREMAKNNLVKFLNEYKMQQDNLLENSFEESWYREEN